MQTLSHETPAQMADRKLRARDAASYLGLAPATLSKYRCLGGGPPFMKLGRAVVYSRRDLDAWCDEKGKHASTAGYPAVRA